uniref:Uncharacterized protein n=1 Tax=Anguilla anguilla TaxID=7936 RepID=A0A0E9VWN0_ANGAN
MFNVQPGVNAQCQTASLTALVWQASVKTPGQ